MIQFTVPTRYVYGKTKKKSFPFNANAFANNHHRIKHNAKMALYEYMETLEVLKDLKYTDPIRLHLWYYTERKPNFDEDNISFGIHKFVADALVHLKVIKDDDFTRVKLNAFKYMGIDKTAVYSEFPCFKGRCDIFIEKL